MPQGAQGKGYATIEDLKRLLKVARDAEVEEAELALAKVGGEEENGARAYGTSARVKAGPVSLERLTTRIWTFASNSHGVDALLA